MIKRKSIVFHGRVQGVGFRWTASQIAGEYGLTGWVRNEYDGTVTMEVQGSQDLIDNLVDRLYRDTYIRIDSMEVRTLSVVPEERGFKVRGY
ncbi:MAG: acylphosphatase [Acutalibacteraceae bacterium]|nr:acylphosphatase [Acutalibacteraceae bacterium]